MILFFKVSGNHFIAVKSEKISQITIWKNFPGYSVEPIMLEDESIEGFFIGPGRR